MLAFQCVVVTDLLPRFYAAFASAAEMKSSTRLESRSSFRTNSLPQESRMIVSRDGTIMTVGRAFLLLGLEFQWDECIGGEGKSR